MKIIQATQLGSFDVLAEGNAVVAKSVPQNTSSREIAIGRDLHVGPRTVFVECTDAADKRFLCAVPPQLQFIFFDGVDAKLGLLARDRAFWPHVTQQTVRLQCSSTFLAMMGQSITSPR